MEREEPKDLINSDQQPRSDTSHVDPQGVRARDVFDDGQADRHEDTSDKHKNAPIVSIAQPGGISASSQDVPKASTDQDATSLYLAGRTQEDIAPNPPDTAEANDDTNPDDVVADGDAANAQEDGEKAESVTTSNHSKRRKRGARKGARWPSSSNGRNRLREWLTLTPMTHKLEPGSASVPFVN